MDADLLVEVGVVAAVLGLLWVLPDWPRYRDLALRVGRAPHLVQPAAPIPSGPPIERIAADAQRIRAQLTHVPPGAPVARRRGWLMAYDDLLVDACRALGLEQRLGTLPEGPARELERERIERMLERAGFSLRSPGSA